MPTLNTTANRCVNTSWLGVVRYGQKLPRMHDTAQRLYQAAKEVAGLTMPAKVAIALGEAQQTLKHWEKRGVSQRGQLHACDLWGLSVQWMREGTGPMKAGAVVTPVANPVIYTLFDDQLLTGEQIMGMGELPARFVFALEDDAMGDFGRAGTQVVFESASEARPGAGVLVRDRDGQLSVRRKAQGRSQAHWLAVAPNGVYRSLDSEADGLEMLAVWRGVVNRGLEDQ